jgi:hypothetical protein
MKPTRLSSVVQYDLYQECCRVSRHLQVIVRSMHRLRLINSRHKLAVQRRAMEIVNETSNPGQTAS